ncbi:MAG TPA: rhodanese-like domain-containing protein [Steroidobacteraceae bacterium]|nr:rhodanese-like domain-containing protein [Steroidobacteraceae bacterium]
MYAFFMGLNTISPDELHRSMEEGTPITVIDVNSQQSWRNAHVAGALNLDPQQYTERDLPADKNVPLVSTAPTPCVQRRPVPRDEPKTWGTRTCES